MVCLLFQALETLNKLACENVIVTDPLAWTLRRVCELLPHFALANTKPLVNILSEGLDKEPRVAVKVCSVRYSKICF